MAEKFINIEILSTSDKYVFNNSKIGIFFLFAAQIV
jgi:hypothetical protein